MEAAAELDSYVDKEKIKEKRDKERQKERARVEKDKENDEGNANNTLLMPFSIPWIPHFLIPKIDMSVLCTCQKCHIHDLILQKPSRSTTVTEPCAKGSSEPSQYTSNAPGTSSF